MSTPMQQYASFVLDGMQFGVDVAHVQEVLRLRQYTPVPLARREVLGLMNLRGQISPALDLRARLGLTPRLPGGVLPTVVVHRGDEAVGLVVDAIADVHALAGDAGAPPPPTIPAHLRPYVTAVHSLEAGLLLVLDLDAVLTFDPTHRTESP